MLAQQMLQFERKHKIDPPSATRGAEMRAKRNRSSVGTSRPKRPVSLPELAKTTDSGQPGRSGVRRLTGGAKSRVKAPPTKGARSLARLELMFKKGELTMKEFRAAKKKVKVSVQLAAASEREHPPCESSVAKGADEEGGSEEEEPAEPQLPEQPVIPPIGGLIPKNAAADTEAAAAVDNEELPSLGSPAGIPGGPEAEAARLAWVKRVVCDGLHLEGKYFDEHSDSKLLRAFLKEEKLATEAWLLFYAGTELDAPPDWPEPEPEPEPGAELEVDDGDDPEMLAKESALRDAAKAGDIDSLSELLAEGVAVDAVDDKGYTATYTATMYEHLDAVAVLLDAGAEVDKENHNGVSPLMAAARDGYTPIVIKLMQAGADFTQVDEFGRTAESLAEEKGHPETSSAVKEFAANNAPPPKKVAEVVEVIVDNTEPEAPAEPEYRLWVASAKPGGATSETELVYMVREAGRSLYTGAGCTVETVMRGCIRHGVIELLDKEDLPMLSARGTTPGGKRRAGTSARYSNVNGMSAKEQAEKAKRRLEQSMQRPYDVMLAMEREALEEVRPVSHWLYGSTAGCRGSTIPVVHLLAHLTC